MNIGGDSGRDDYGLPPVDIEIPDDARELGRDVQAYYRELRALRRRRLARRLCAPLARDGLVLPVLAGCLALTLLAGTLLTVFGQEPTMTNATPGGLGGHISPGPVSPGPVSSRPGQVGSSLPDSVVIVGGQPEPLRELAGVVLLLALVPPGCQCVPDLRQLSSQANQAGVQMYLVGASSTRLSSLSMQVGLGAAHAVEDVQNSLPAFYRPGTLTAVLVRADRSIARVVTDQGRGFQLLGLLRSLTAGQPQARSQAPPTTSLPTTALPRYAPAPGTAAARTGSTVSSRGKHNTLPVVTVSR